MNPCSIRRSAALLCLSFAVAASLFSQQTVTASDYARAEKFLLPNAERIVTGTVRPFWIGDTEQFWFRKTTPDSGEFILVDAVTRAQQPAFDHSKLAAALSHQTGQSLDPHHLPFQLIEFSPDLHSVTINLGPRRRFVCDRAGASCAPAPATANEALSPDGKRAVFIRDWNLWIRDVASDRETQLTHDGVENFGYATDNAGWASSERPVVLWSPDSKKIATFQQDQRLDGEMYTVETKLGHPQCCTPGNTRSPATTTSR